MLEPLVIAYAGDEKRGLDVIKTLDQRLQRPVHLLTTAAGSIAELLDGKVVDAVVCGTVDSDVLESITRTVADHSPDVPVFDMSGSVGVVPDTLEFHRVSPGGSRDETTANLAEAVLGATTRRRQRQEPSTLGRHIVLTRDWTVADWDPRLEEWTGYAPEDTTHEQFWELLPEWEDTEFATVCRTAQTKARTQTAELYHGPIDQRLGLRVVPLPDGGIECFLRDIGRSDENDSGRSLEETLERITDAFFALDNEYRFVLLNSNAEEVLDVDAERVTGVRFWDAFPAAMSSRFYREVTAAMESQQPTSFEDQYRPQDQWFEVNAYPSEDGLSVFLRDITEQVELQQKLESLHRITRELIVAESDTEIATRTIDAAEEVLGFDIVALWRYDDATDKLDPLAWSETIDERVGELGALGRDSEFIWRVYETGESRRLGSVLATTTTSHHPGDVSSELLVPIGDYGVLGVYSDDTEAFDDTDADLVRLLASTVESAFARTLRERQLAQRNEQLNDFASVVSHDLRNPLNVASAHAELAREMDDPAPHLDKIDGSLERMETLIEDLLARARGDQDLDREPLSLEGCARDAWASIDADGATLELEGDATLTADPDRLRQLFENLFRNSVEHGGTDVTIRVGPTADGFFVADDGDGIPEGKRTDIFEQGVTHSESGTGYGLAIVTDIVEGHGWSITVGESDDGGARFGVTGIRSLADPREATQ